MWPTILLLSSIHLFTIERGPRWLFYGSKPLPVLLMAALITLNPTVDANLAFWIFSGLILSAIGDVLLSLPKDNYQRPEQLPACPHLLCSWFYWHGEHHILVDTRHDPGSRDSGLFTAPA